MLDLLSSCGSHKGKETLALYCLRMFPCFCTQYNLQLCINLILTENTCTYFICIFFHNIVYLGYTSNENHNIIYYSHCLFHAYLREQISTEIHAVDPYILGVYFGFLKKIAHRKRVLDSNSEISRLVLAFLCTLPPNTLECYI